MNDLIVRPLELEDLEIYEHLRMEMVKSDPLAFDLLLEMLMKRTGEEWRRDHDEAVLDPRRQRFLALYANVAVGIVGAYPEHDYMKVGGLFVVDAMRRHRIGTALLYTCHDFAKEEGFTKLGLQVSSENPIARSWYERIDFKPTDPPTITPWLTRPDVYDELLMKQL